MSRRRIVRMYYPAWAAIRANAANYTIIECQPAMRARIKKGIIDEKNLDRQFASSDGRKLYFVEIPTGWFIELTYAAPRHWPIYAQNLAATSISLQQERLNVI